MKDNTGNHSTEKVENRKSKKEYLENFNNIFLD